MLSAVCIGTNNLDAARDFYDKLLATIGMVSLAENESEVGYGIAGEESTFWVLLPYNKEPATFGNGSQVMFRASSPEIVNEFYNVAISCGSKDEGAPGPRHYAENYYGAYVRDLDHNKLHVFYLP